MARTNIFLLVTKTTTTLKKLQQHMKRQAKDYHPSIDVSSGSSSLNPCDAVASRRASSSTAGDSSVSPLSQQLSFGCCDRRESLASNNSSRNSHPCSNDSANNSRPGAAGRSMSLISKQLDKDDANKRFRRYGRARSLQDFGDGAFAAAAAAAASSFVENDPRAINKRMEKSRPKCEHYERQCTIVSPCCGLAFGCRICHDECPVLPPPLGMSRQKQFYDDEYDDDGETEHSSNEVVVEQHKHSCNQMVDDGDALCSKPLAAKAAATTALGVMGKKMKNKDRRRSMPIDLEEEETHHNIDRFAIREIICRECYARQSSKTYVYYHLFYVLI